ncbi:hypothetical protein BDV25DRAFT_156920 [Aspergillus avenaceus]|uniref:F-box domain-containing protein n=1 Tax=Aspergillus avenaceus TaxID=36643 RepID=A0A5N6TRY0_ASPAV|nr:hypothetical protein BDV25DRAFT_156920 [Aspergillus avenaceus]
MNAPSDPHIYSLPNELFVHILSPFPTSSLLPLATVSHRFHALILRILHYRLLISASLNEYKLILECFHPSSKLIEPHVFCKYLGTDGLSDQHEGKGSLYENVDTAQQLARLGSLYSRFRPEVTVEERSSGTRLIPSTNTIEQPDDLLVTRPINLEANEDFSQLCVVVNVVKVMPGSNLLLSAVTVEDGVIRLFRNWLKTRTKHSNQPSGFSSPAGRLDKNIGSFSNEDSSHLLWVGQSQNVGLKVRVREKVDQSRHFPILVHRDEEESTSYELDIEELHIRTTRLLMTTEQSLEQQDYLKAVIFTGNSR